MSDQDVLIAKIRPLRDWMANELLISLGKSRSEAFFALHSDDQLTKWSLDQLKAQLEMLTAARTEMEERSRALNVLMQEYLDEHGR